MNITDLPVEILEHVVHEIEDAKDLLYFALTNKHFSQLIIQPHLKFRIIRCVADTRLIWSKLASRPDLCAKIRELHVYVPASRTIQQASCSPILHINYPHGPSLPPYLLHDDSATLQICSAERSMQSSLYDFPLSLYDIPPLVTNLTKVSLVFPNNTLPTNTLKTVLDKLSRYSSSRLRDVAITWEGPQGDSDVLQDHDHFSSLWTLSDLTVFHFNVLYPSLDNREVDRMFHLIVDRCPNLEKLCINFRSETMYPTRLNGTWKRANWEHLHTLCLGVCMTLEDVEDGNMFRDFMARHPGLECLEYLGYEGGHLFSRHFVDLLRTNVFRNIRALNMRRIPTTLYSRPKFWMLNSKNVPVPQGGVFEKVEYLSIKDCNGTFFEKSYTPSLRMLIITHTSCYWKNLQYCDFRVSETLERLCIKANFITHDDQIHAFITELLVKSALPNLTHLCISVADGAGTLLSRPEKTLQEISKASASLKYFGLDSIWEGDFFEVWVRLIRDNSGEYAAYEIDISVEPVFTWWKFSSQ